MPESREKIRSEVSDQKNFEILSYFDIVLSDGAYAASVRRWCVHASGTEVRVLRLQIGQLARKRSTNVQPLVVMFGVQLTAGIL